MMMYANALPGTTAIGLKKLGGIQLLRQAYLAGMKIDAISTRSMRRSF